MEDLGDGYPALLHRLASELEPHPDGRVGPEKTRPPVFQLDGQRPEFGHVGVRPRCDRTACGDSRVPGPADPGPPPSTTRLPSQPPRPLGRRTGSHSIRTQSPGFVQPPHTYAPASRPPSVPASHLRRQVRRHEAAQRQAARPAPMWADERSQPPPCRPRRMLHGLSPDPPRPGATGPGRARKRTRTGAGRFHPVPSGSSRPRSQDQRTDYAPAATRFCRDKGQGRVGDSPTPSSFPCARFSPTS